MHACMETERDTGVCVVFLVTNILVTVSGSSAVVCVETEGVASVLRDATEQCYQKISPRNFHVGQANLIRHMRMGGNDNVCLLETAPIQNMHAHIYSNYIIIESVF